jgi:hypothetical protein
VTGLRRPQQVKMRMTLEEMKFVLRIMMRKNQLCRDMWGKKHLPMYRNMQVQGLKWDQFARFEVQKKGWLG